MATKQLKKDLDNYEKAQRALSGAHNKRKFNKAEAFKTISNKYKLLECTDSYMQYKQFGGPNSMDAYATMAKQREDKL